MPDDGRLLAVDDPSKRPALVARFSDQAIAEDRGDPGVIAAEDVLGIGEEPELRNGCLRPRQAPEFLGAEADEVEPLGGEGRRSRHAA